MASSARRDRVARAIMQTRVRWGWTFGKQRLVMAIDLLMAEAGILVLLDTGEGESGKP